jgi:hypothetical protein
MRSIIRWKVLPVLRSPKGMRRNSNNPNGVQMAVFLSWVHRYLIITLPKVNFAKDLAPSDPGRKIQHVGQRIVSGSVTRLRRRKSSHGRHVPSFYITMCRGLAHGEVERCMIPSLSSCSNSALAA